tara:strand:- start:1251 stop:2156 length:906 start_codon:yes stop_codon:yes gene_type:complete
MEYSEFRRKRRLERNAEGESPAKFLSFLFGGKKRRREQRAANEDHEFWMEEWSQQKMKNPYAGMKNPYADMENVYEDARVNLQAADYAKEQSQQNMANIMNNMSTAAGSSGVAGLAQVLANQGVQQARQQAVDIGNQEQQNELRARAEAGRLDQLEREGEQKRDLMVREGERLVEAFDFKKVEDQLGLATKRKGFADAAVDKAKGTRDSMLSAAVSAIPGVGPILGGILSDIRVKENITRTGTSKSGIPTYTFNYKNDDQLWSGAIAQDLLELGMDNAVSTRGGYYTIDYDKIDVDMIAKN